MRYLQIVMIGLGAVMLLVPIGFILWFWIVQLKAPAYQDTYYVVASWQRLAVYFGAAFALFFGGFWLRNARKEE